MKKIDQFHKWLNETEFYIGLRQDTEILKWRLYQTQIIRKKFEEMFEIE